MAQKMDIDNPLHRSRMITKILEGGKVALPTETVYGLAVRADDDQAIHALYQKKGRPPSNPLIVHYASWQDVFAHFSMNERALSLARHFWPGPLTLILDIPPHHYISSHLSAGLSTIAVRVPQHPFTRSLIQDTTPLAMPSANISGSLSPTLASHVMDAFPCNDILVADGGACTIGLESTVVDVRHHNLILRPGAITRDDLKPWGTFNLSSPPKNHTPSSPGCLPSHYAPSRPLRMNVTSPQKDEAFLGFADSPHALYDLSPQGCLREASRNLYHYLHLLDRNPFTAIAVAPIPLHGLGAAINDRLTRASFPASSSSPSSPSSSPSSPSSSPSSSWGVSS